MVARFANKNVIALGLGCSSSGPLILILKLSLGIKTMPTHSQQTTLFMLIFALVAAGLWATVSLLLRHWDAIEATTTGGKAEPTIDPTEIDGNPGELNLSLPLLRIDTEAGRSLPATPRNIKQAEASPRSHALFREPSLPPLLAYNLLEPYGTFLSAEDDWQARPPSSSRRRTSESREGSQRGFRRTSESREGSQRGFRRGGDGQQQGLFRTVSSSSDILTRAVALAQTEAGHYNAAGNTNNGIYSTTTRPVAHTYLDILNGAEARDDELFSDEEEEEEVHSGGAALLQTAKDAWPALFAIGLQAGIALTLFPFFTYLPSSGRFGDELPAVLFFVRIFCDIIGKMLPRVSYFKPTTIWPVVAVAVAKLTAEPFFFLYLRSSEHWHSDILASVYIGLMWAAGGYVNTTANMVAPHMVQPQYKSTAMALMALVYQMGHFVGLAFAALLVHVMYGALGVDG